VVSEPLLRSIHDAFGHPPRLPMGFKRNKARSVRAALDPPAPVYGLFH
jgi:hypothetical protein